MHSFLTRLNALVAFMLSVLAAVTFGAFLTTCLNEYSQPVDLMADSIKVKLLPDYVAAGARHDLAHMTMDVNVDLTPLFNWNVKQLFLYLTAEYETPSNAFNQVVLWDKIVRRGEQSVLDIKSIPPKYYFWDDGTGLLGNDNVTLKLYWNVMPNAGYMFQRQGQGVQTVKFPDTYSTSKF